MLRKTPAYMSLFPSLALPEIESHSLLPLTMQFRLRAQKVVSAFLQSQADVSTPEAQWCEKCVFGSALNFAAISTVTPLTGEELILRDDQHNAAYEAIASGGLPTAQIAEFSRGVLADPLLNHTAIVTLPYSPFIFIYVFIYWGLVSHID